MEPPNTYEAPSRQRVDDSSESRPEAAIACWQASLSAPHSVFASLCGAGFLDSAPNTYRDSRSIAKRRSEREGSAFTGDFADSIGPLREILLLTRHERRPRPIVRPMR